MNLELFMVFTVLSIVLIFLGYYTKPSIKVLALVGFASIFLLMLLLQFGGITQQTGSTVTDNGGSYSIAYSYQTIDDSTSVWIGRWISIVAVLGGALVLTSNRDDDD